MTEAATYPPAPSSSTALPMASSPTSLTLILAATRNMGIGRAGSLPWPMLKSEMAYFARVTKRAPSADSVNAVIMGRRTWESIPQRLRPLKGRVNFVISRQRELDLGDSGKGGGDSGILASSLEDVIAILRDHEAFRRHAEGKCQAIAEGKKLGRVFVIGGAEVYRAALALEDTKRILLTDVKTDFECDTFFPLDLTASPTTEATGDQSSSWIKKSTEELEAWAVEDGLAGIKTEGQVDFVFCMYERV